MFNPALVQGCHGDNLNSALNSIYKGSFQNEGSSVGKDDFSDNVVPSGNLTWEQMYYRMLQDPSFKKFSLSSGIKLSGLHPMIYNVASNHQILPNEASADVGGLTELTATGDPLAFNGNTRGQVPDGTSGGKADVYPTFMTNRLQSLGWMDTRQVLNSYRDVKARVDPAYTVLPKIFMACIILPMAKSDSVVTSMRFVVTHYFAFKEFNTSLTLEGASEYYDWLTTQTKKNDTLEVQSDPSIENVELVSDGVF